MNRFGISLLTALLTLISAMHATAAPTAPSRVIRAYYFHGSLRCATCHKLEDFAREAIQASFSKELKAGTLVWQAINIENPGYEHFVKDYDLFAKAIVVSDVADGEQKRWKNLSKIWELVGDEKAYKKYVVDEVRQYLEGRS